MIEKEEIALRIHGLVSLIEKKDISSDSMAGGRAAIALLYFYYGKCFNIPGYQEKGLQLVEEIFSNLEQGNDQALGTYDFFSGLTGMLSMLAVLKNNELLDIDFEDFASLDKMVYDWAIKELDNSNIDFFYGATGVLSYFRQRTDLDGQNEYVESLVKKILELLNENDHVIINRFYNQADDRYAKEVNFSLAHGMVSLLNCLLDMYKAGFRKYELGPALEKSIERIISYAISNPPPAPHCFVNAVSLEPEKLLHQPRLGWCFSDLNILHLLYKGASILDKKEWKQLADEKAGVVAARVSLSDTLVEDAFICRGSAGLFQYYQSLYDMSEGHPSFEKASGFWLQAALDHIDKVPAAYYDTKEFSAKSHVHSLFYGLTGVALCFISAYEPGYSSWRTIIML